METLQKYHNPLKKKRGKRRLVFFRKILDNPGFLWLYKDYRGGI